MYLDRIVEARRLVLAREMEAIPPEIMVQQGREATETARPSFRDALTQSDLGIIGEVKKASPSKGLIRPDFDPVSLAGAYEGHVDAVSVLTEETFFCGSSKHLETVVQAYPHMAYLRKDFILEAYQIHQARALGASAVLLIAALLDTEILEQFRLLAEELGMEALVEIHDRQELERALDSGARMIGINNRSLLDFSVSLETTLDLAPLIPADRIVISESGFFSAKDVRLVKPAGIDGILVGESFMRAEDMGRLAREFKDAYRD